MIDELFQIRTMAAAAYRSALHGLHLAHGYYALSENPDFAICGACVEPGGMYGYRFFSEVAKLRRSPEFWCPGCMLAYEYAKATIHPAWFWFVPLAEWKLRRTWRQLLKDKK